MTDKTEIDNGGPVGEDSLATDGPPKKFRLKKMLTLKMIIIYCVVILLVALSLLAWWFFFLRGPDITALEKAKQSGQKIQTGKNAVQVEKPPQFKDIVNLDPFVKVKLNPSGKFSSISMKIALQLSDHNMRQAIESDKNMIRGIITHETEKMTWLVLRKPEGKLRLKYRLIEKINSALSKSSNARITTLYFTHFIMQ